MAATMMTLAACAQTQGPKVMARYVPERAEDFVFENNLICGRIYGKALEGNPTSPGIDVWVKLPGKLVANEWYSHIGEHGNEGYYHRDHGGKDCYKVSVSLGAGASAPIINKKICYPATNYRSWEILEQTDDKVVFTLSYPEWEAAPGVMVSLDKTITVLADTYFLKVEDRYSFTGESLCVAAGIFRHLKQKTIEQELTLPDRYAIWEHASDTGHEPEDGMIGVAVYMPGADAVELSGHQSHGLVMRKIVPGETVTYYAGNCWSKGDIKSAEAWFKMVKGLQ